MTTAELVARLREAADSGPSRWVVPLLLEAAAELEEAAAAMARLEAALVIDAAELERLEALLADLSTAPEALGSYRLAADVYDAQRRLAAQRRELRARP